MQKAARDYELTQQSIAARFVNLKLKTELTTDSELVVAGEIAKVRELVERLSRIQRAAEGFAFNLAKIADQAMTVELERNVEATRTDLAREENELAQRVATGARAQRIIEALREAASALVTQRVLEIEPLLADFYGRIDVHPAFRVVRFLASITAGRGRLSTVIQDPTSNVESDAPGTVLSSSQMNALAISTFLSLNLGVASPPLETTILDDPLQSLDDSNLLGLIELLRRTKDRRQVCVSTHDARFGNLLARKLRPKSDQQRTIVIELDNWDRNGPRVRLRDVRADPAPIRLVAS